jgi:TonB family protein
MATLAQRLGVAPWLIALVASACGGADVRSPGSPATAGAGDGVGRRGDGPRQRFLPGEDDADDDGMQVEGLRGHLDPSDVEAGIQPRSAELAACYESYHQRQRYLEGAVELAFQVDPAGAVTAVKVFDSSLGAWPVEKCLLDIARGIRFKPPRGRGSAEFSVPLDFAAGSHGAMWLTEEQSEVEVGAQREQLASCAELDGVATPEDVWVTLYVGRRGKVLSVGFATRGAQPIADEWAACAEQVVMAWQLTDPRGRVHKLGVRYNP